MKKQKGIKNAIVVLSVLLVLFIAVLVALYIYLKSVTPKKTVAVAPYNEITQSETVSTASDKASQKPTTTAKVEQNIAQSNSNTFVAEQVTESDSTELSLYNKQPTDNTAFNVNNMLPGDSVKKYYNVNVSYREAVTVHFGTDIKKDDCLSDVLKVRVCLDNSDNVLYDGLLRDVPNSLDVSLNTPNGATQTVLCYEITAYLDTSVGNKYAQKALIADFNWWVDDTDSLGAAPATGEVVNIALLWVILSLSAVLVIGLYAFYKGRRRESE